LGQQYPEKSVSDHEALHALIKACIAENRTAQKELYIKFSPMLFGVIKRYVYDVNTAQEILSDSFFKIFTKLHLYSFKGAFEGWIRRIAINSITDHIRKNIKHSQTIDPDLASEKVYVADSAVSRLTYKELLQCVHELPETQRAVFNLFVFEDYSHKEISEHLGINENNSRWHLNDARRRLKEKIKTML
jgi:RNA polymerase sigma-70 factor (ECF subfamily)